MPNNNSSIIQQLESLYRQGLIPVSSIEFAHFLKEVFFEIEEEVLLAGFLAFHVTTQGDTHFDLLSIENQVMSDEAFVGLTFPEKNSWIKTLNQSNAVVRPGGKGVLVLEHDRYLYVHKYWFYEYQIAEWVRRRMTSTYGNERQADPFLKDLLAIDNEEQNRALTLSLSNRFSIISGGPGTGKTHTVFKIILAHIRKASNQGIHLRIALCAPTGKAAARLIEALSLNIEQTGVNDEELLQFPEAAHTIHSLLGVNRNGSFKHHKENKLAYDLIIIDEASMIDVGLMYRLTEAISENSNVLLLGDKDQLASVEAGSVFGDLCIGLTESANAGQVGEMALKGYSTLLQKSYRFADDSEIKLISDYIINEQRDELHKYLLDRKDLFIEWDKDIDAPWIYDEYVWPHYQKYVEKQNIDESFELFNKQKILSPIRKSRFGVDWLNAYFEQKIKSELNIPLSNIWYPGRPILITMNDKSLQLRNGDTGICNFKEGKPVVYFASRDDGYLCIDAERIEKYELAFVSTVHKSQGSEYEKVLLLLPDKENRILSKQLLYTAVTRARKSILIVGRDEVLLNSLKNNVVRYTGLSRKL